MIRMAGVMCLLTIDRKVYLVVTLFVALSSFAVKGQQPKAAEPLATPAANQKAERPELLRQLGLSPEQVANIRRLNQDRKPIFEKAQLRLRDAVKSLDEAIYSDVLNEEDVAVKMREVQSAQADVQKLRYANELAVRKILTPEQLLRFRGLREEFAASRQQIRQRRGANRFPTGVTKPVNKADPAGRIVNPTNKPRKPFKR